MNVKKSDWLWWLIKLDVLTRQKPEDLKFKINPDSPLCAGEMTRSVKALIKQAWDSTSIPGFHGGESPWNLPDPVHPSVLSPHIHSHDNF